MIATVGVVITALRPGGQKSFADLRPTVLGLGAAAVFAISAVSFRGAIIAVPGVSFVTAASYTLMWSLFVQTLILSVYLLAACARRAEVDPCAVAALAVRGLHGRVLVAVLVPGVRAHRRGHVRTLALIEVLFAQGVAYFRSSSHSRCANLLGIVLIGGRRRRC